jgi:hypothetical protein
MTAAVRLVGLHRAKTLGHLVMNCSALQREGRITLKVTQVPGMPLPGQLRDVAISFSGAKGGVASQASSDQVVLPSNCRVGLPGSRAAPSLT